MRWIEIFKSGIQTDSQGRKHDGAQLIDKAVSTFDAAQHEPPLVIGHPATNAPAWGWVDGLRKVIKDGKAVLEASVKQLHPDFAAMVRQGLFKKRSASFFDDGRLRHVGFLGAAAPAVKGLADVAFAEGANVINFNDLDLGGADAAMSRIDAVLETLKKVRTWIAEKFDDETAEKLVPARLTTPEREQPGGGSFTGADLERARAEGAAAAKAEAARERRRAEIAARVDGLVEGGMLPPAFVAAGIKDFCEFLGSSDGVVEFAEDSGLAAVPPVDFFLDFIERFSPFKAMFSEIATKDRRGERQVDPDVAAGLDLAERASRHSMEKGKQG